MPLFFSITLTVFVLAVIASSLISACASTPELGPVEGRLRPCPSSPNCVNSQDPDENHRVEAIAFEGDATEAWLRIRTAVEQLPRTRITVAEEGYLRAETRSRLFRFVDDLELLLDAETSVIHVRSAARSGYSDFGANRKRVERLRELFQGAGSPR